MGRLRNWRLFFIDDASGKSKQQNGAYNLVVLSGIFNQNKSNKHEKKQTKNEWNQPDIRRDHTSISDE